MTNTSPGFPPARRGDKGLNGYYLWVMIWSVSDPSFHLQKNALPVGIQIMGDYLEDYTTRQGMVNRFDVLMKQDMRSRDQDHCVSAPSGIN